VFLIESCQGDRTSQNAGCQGDRRLGEESGDLRLLCRPPARPHTNHALLHVHLPAIYKVLSNFSRKPPRLLTQIFVSGGALAVTPFYLFFILPTKMNCPFIFTTVVTECSSAPSYAQITQTSPIFLIGTSLSISAYPYALYQNPPQHFKI
jgi:hypothetical protein